MSQNGDNLAQAQVAHWLGNKCCGAKWLIHDMCTANICGKDGWKWWVVVVYRIGIDGYNCVQNWLRRLQLRKVEYGWIVFFRSYIVRIYLFISFCLSVSPSDFFSPSDSQSIDQRRVNRPNSCLIQRTLHWSSVWSALIWRGRSKMSNC